MELYLYIEVQLLCVLIFALLLVKVHRNTDKSSEQILFCYLLISCIVTFSIDAVWSVVNGDASPGWRFLNNFMNVLYYLSLAANGFLWFLYSEMVQKSAIAASKRKQVYCAIPAIVLCILALASPFTGALFYLDGKGDYQRGPLHFVQLLISYGYLLSTSIKALIAGLHAKEYHHRQRLLTIAAFIVPSMVAGALQTLLPGIPIIPAGAVVSLIFIYASLQEQRIVVDRLTGVFNRNQLMGYLESRIDRARIEEERFALLLMDVDGFKSINDRYGHLEGDNALMRIGAALRSLRQHRATGVFRYGGDEFIVVDTIDSEEEIRSLVQRVNDAIEAQNRAAQAPYNLTVSIGWAVYDASMHTPQDLIKKADAYLYEQKSLRKAKTA